MYTITTKESGSDHYIKSSAHSLPAVDWVGYVPLLIAGLLTMW